MQTGRLSCRSAFISDVHLGTRGCQAEMLLEFIRAVDCQTLYLVGDIVDGWKLKSGWFWPQAHNDVVQKILRLARRGVKVIYVPGNHDDRVRDFCGVHFGGVEVVRDHVHRAADGRRYLVIHGDEFDGVVTHAKWLAFAGDWGYRLLLAVNTRVNRARTAFGLKPWSLSAFVKTRVKKALQFIENFEEALATEAKRRGVDGVICGHIHKAEMRDIAGVRYINDGDWVESCTAVVEHADGRFEIIDWHAWRRAHPAPVAAMDEAPEMEPDLAPA
jgi:UDP-2,3-diacylglucosamine pyrophosphatase LpxH